MSTKSKQISKHPLTEQCMLYYFWVIAFSFLSRPLTPPPLHSTFIHFPSELSFMLHAIISHIKGLKESFHMKSIYEH